MLVICFLAHVKELPIVRSALDKTIARNFLFSFYSPELWFYMANHPKKVSLRSTFDYAAYAALNRVINAIKVITTAAHTKPRAWIRPNKGHAPFISRAHCLRQVKPPQVRVPTTIPELCACAKIARVCVVPFQSAWLPF